MSLFGVFLVHTFPNSDRTRTRKTGNTDTFHVVTAFYHSECGHYPEELFKTKFVNEYFMSKLQKDDEKTEYWLTLPMIKLFLRKYLLAV